jgi:hypothetical protein
MADDLFPEFTGWRKSYSPPASFEALRPQSVFVFIQSGDDDWIKELSHQYLN